MMRAGAFTTVGEDLFEFMFFIPCCRADFVAYVRVLKCRDVDIGRLDRDVHAR